MGLFNLVRTATSKNSAAAATAVANSDTIPMGRASGGSFRVRSGTVATITFYGAGVTDGTTGGGTSNVEGTFEPLYDNQSTPVAITMAVTTGKRYQLPDACFGLHALRMVGDAAGVIDYTLVS